MKHYLEIEAFSRRSSALSHLASIAYWDQAVHMPSGGNEARSQALAEVNVLLTEQIQGAEIREHVELAEAEKNQLNEMQLANLREFRRKWKLANSVDKDLVRAKTLADMKCEHAWRTLRADNNWKDFLPLFTDVIRLVREESLQRAQAVQLTPYEAMLDIYNPGIKINQIESLFQDLKNFLPTFIPQVLEHQKRFKLIQQPIDYSVEKQQALGLEMMRQVGFNLNHGRLDVSHHPFCGGVPQDVRITTRYDESDFIQSFASVVHEAGHACYEQNLPRQWLGQAVSDARGMSIHESLSLFFEMQIMRNHAFLKFATPIMRDHLEPKSQSEFWSVENIYRRLTRVQPGFIRVDADEVTYPMHVILRFEIEKMILSNEIEAKDIPDVWHDKMQKYLGISTLGNYKDGCMQDVHWPSGWFGYFPSYSLGALMAAQLFAALKKQHPNIEDEIASGHFSIISQWLRENIWQHGSLYSTDELIMRATGKELSADAFIAHVKSRYLNGAMGDSE